MEHPVTSAPTIRRLGSRDQQAIVAHFLGLGPEASRLRFGAAVNSTEICAYADAIFKPGSYIYGAFDRTSLCGLAELHRLPNTWPPEYEAAFSVDPGSQDQGIGDALIARLLTVAQNRHIKSLHMLCLRENHRMQHLVTKHGAILHVTATDAEATLDPPWPTPLSLGQEWAGEYREFVRSVIDWTA